MGGYEALDSLGDWGCQLLAVADGRGGTIVAQGALGSNVRGQQGLVEGDRLLWVLQDAPIAFEVPGGLLVLLLVCVVLWSPQCPSSPSER